MRKIGKNPEIFAILPCSPQQKRPQPVYCLGRYLLDLEKQLLSAHGKTVHLSRKPYQVLLYLIENRHRLVSRNELLEEFWGGKEVYDQTLSKAVGAIRKALGEPRETEVFIETRWAAGYRYIGPFEELTETGTSTGEESPLESAPTVDRSPVEVSPTNPEAVTRPIESHSFWKLDGFAKRPRLHSALLLILLLLVFGGAVWGGRYLATSAAIASAFTSDAHLRVRPSVAVFAFKNLSERPDEQWIGGALAEMLFTEMGADGRLRTIPGETIARATKELNLGEQSGFAPKTLASVRQNLGADYVVTGAFTVVDGGRGSSAQQLRLDICMQDTKSAETISTFANEANVRQLFSVATTAAGQIIQGLRLPGITPKTEELARAALPSNPVATQLYMEGLEKLRRQDLQQARDVLEKAVQADPEFPLAHLALADAWRGLGYLDNEKAEAARAVERSSHLSREVQLYVQARYSFASRDWDKTIETYQTLVNLYPDNIEYGLQLADAQSVAGKPEAAVATISALRKMASPSAEDPRLDMAEALARRALSDFQGSARAAGQAAEKARTQKAPLLYARALSVKAAALTDVDPHEAIRLIEESRGICEQYQDIGCLTSAYHRLGNLQIDSEPDTAETNLRQSLRLARQVGDRFEENNNLNSIGVLLSNQGRLNEAAKVYEELLTRERDLNSPWGTQMVLNNLGEGQIRQGNLAEALANEQKALAIARKIGIKAGVGDELLDIAQINELQGDLGTAEKNYTEALTVFEEIKAAEGSAIAEAGLGSINRYRGDLTAARKHYQLSLDKLVARRPSSELAATQLAMARVNLDDGRDSEAISLSTAATEGFHKLRRAAEEASARAFLATVFAKRGDSDAAKEQAEKSRHLIQGSESLLSQLDVRIALARINVLISNSLNSEQRFADIKQLRDLSARARSAGMLSLELQANLASLEVQVRAPHSSARVTSLDELERKANQKGFVLISQQAHALRNSASAQLSTSCCSPSSPRLR